MTITESRDLATQHMVAPIFLLVERLLVKRDCFRSRFGGSQFQRRMAAQNTVHI